MATVPATAALPRTRPMLVTSPGLPDPCAHCGSRPQSVCSAIEDRDLDQLAAVALPGRVEAGQSFITEGDQAADFFNITGGTAKLYKLLPDGRRQITGFARTGVFLGLAVSATYSFSAEAIEPVRYCRFPRRRLHALLDDFPALEKRLLQTASNELVAAQEQMLLLGRKTARERLASFLYLQHGQSLACSHDAQHLTLAMTRGDIADYLGLTIETVSRTFTRLKKDGLIAIPTINSITLLDPEGLASLAEGFETEH